MRSWSRVLLCVSLCQLCVEVACLAVERDPGEEEDPGAIQEVPRLDWESVQRYVVSVQEVRDLERVHVCSGTALTRQLALAAAHCVCDEFGLARVTAELLVVSSTGGWGHVTSIRPHRLYVQERSHDLALLGLEKALNLGEPPHAATIASPDFFANSTPVEMFREGCWVVAWEQTPGASNWPANFTPARNWSSTLLEMKMRPVFLLQQPIEEIKKHSQSLDLFLYAGFQELYLDNSSQCISDKGSLLICDDISLGVRSSNSQSCEEPAFHMKFSRLDSQTLWLKTAVGWKAAPKLRVVVKPRAVFIPGHYPGHNPGHPVFYPVYPGPPPWHMAAYVGGPVFGLCLIIFVCCCFYYYY